MRRIFKNTTQNIARLTVTTFALQRDFRPLDQSSSWPVLRQLSTFGSDGYWGGLPGEKRIDTLHFWIVVIAIALSIDRFD
jgi:hypothetical protein